jgi:hypothetical protein
MARELPLNQIRPAARPVDALSVRRRRTRAAPAAPQMMPNPQGIRIIPRPTAATCKASTSSPAGRGAGAVLSKGLMDAHRRRHADVRQSAEYEKGEQRGHEAQALANQQMLQSMGEYASENRKLAQVDPIGALMMDRVNPYRSAGTASMPCHGLQAKEIPRQCCASTAAPLGWRSAARRPPELKKLEARRLRSVTRSTGSTRVRRASWSTCCRRSARPAKS